MSDANMGMAFVAWDHHEGSAHLEELAGYHRDSCVTVSRESASRLMKRAFEAAWTAAGGEQRLEGVEAIAGLLDSCVNDHNYECDRCEALVEVRRALGIEDDDA